MRRNVQSAMRKQRTVALRVTGTGTAVIDEGGSAAVLTDNGTGDYTLTFVEPFIRVPVVMVTTGTASTIARLGTVSATAVQVLTTNLSATATDAIFHVAIVGWDAALV